MLQTNDNIISFIKEDTHYDLRDNEGHISVIKKDNNTLELDIRILDNHFATNMFNINNNGNYYFISDQRVVVRSKKDKRRIGDNNL